mmetsp:Transcript_12957/g.16212  ORF Transcript_12957/g.16212 Transcript_12957/m.16212 type:complete len:118 (-) Transcript_12957:512-865(-)
MKEGEIQTVEIPPEKAFGKGGNPHGFHGMQQKQLLFSLFLFLPQGSGSAIPPLATLIFEDLEIVDLIDETQTATEIKERGNELFITKQNGKALLKYQRVYIFRTCDVSYAYKGITYT